MPQDSGVFLFCRTQVFLSFLQDSGVCGAGRCGQQLPGDCAQHAGRCGVWAHGYSVRACWCLPERLCVVSADCMRGMNLRFTFPGWSSTPSTPLLRHTTARACLCAAERGLRGLYQGYPASLANNSLSMALGFASYEVSGRGFANTIKGSYSNKS